MTIVDLFHETTPTIKPYEIKLKQGAKAVIIYVAGLHPEEVLPELEHVFRATDERYYRQKLRVWYTKSRRFYGISGGVEYSTPFPARVTAEMLDKELQNHSILEDFAGEVVQKAEQKGGLVAVWSTTQELYRSPNVQVQLRQ